MQKIKKKQIAAGIMILVLGSFLLRPVIVKALFDESTAVHIDAASIENSTLIIGTHLIYLYSLNDELYEIATDSASASGQDRTYYKSELAGGAWFDITDAGSIADITTNGQVVSNETVNALYLTHHTKSDGNTYDLRTNQKVCVFDINSPYDLENMEELDSLKLQYDMIEESGANSDTDKRNVEYVKQFFATDMRNSDTNTYDLEITMLQKYYESLSVSDDITKREKVAAVMQKLDNARRADVFTNLDEMLTSLQDKIADSKSEDKDIDYYETDDNLLAAIGNSQTKLSEAIAEAEGNLPEEGTTTLSNKEYEAERALIQGAVSEDYAACEAAVSDLAVLSDLSNELTVSKEAELAMLNELIESAEKKYRQILGTGESEKYKEEKSKNSSDAVLADIMRDDFENAESARNELQFLIKEKTDHLEDADAQDYVKTSISKTSSLVNEIKADDYQTVMQSSVENYKSGLSDILSGIKKADTSEQNNLYEQKESLQEQYLEALDNEDLDQANLLEAQIASLEEQISGEENAKAAVLEDLQNQLEDLQKQAESGASGAALQNQISILESRIAEAEQNLSEDGEAANIIQMKKDAAALLAQQSTDSKSLESVRTSVQGLESMLEAGSSLALTSLKELYQQMVTSAYLNDITAYDTLISEIEDTIAQSDVLELQQKGMTGAAAISAIEEVLDKSITVKETADGENGSQNVSVDGLTEEETSAVLLALSDYAQQSANQEIKMLAAGMAAGCAKEKKAAVFQTYKNEGESYAPADILAAYTGYRYVWNDAKKSVVLSKGRFYYNFSAFSSKVVKENGQSEWMDTAAAFRGTVYLPDSYISTNFECGIYDISGTGYSVLANDNTMELSGKLFDAISGKGGS